jgi:RNA polymerase sigma factor (sigma-70 family)
MNTLVSRYKNSVDANSLVKRVYERYAQKLYGYTRKNYQIGEDDAWTLVYKTIYKIADIYDKYSFENQQKESAFIFKTHINYLRNYYRDNKTFESKNLEVELNENHLADPEEIQVKENQHLKVLQRELDLLEEWERILLLMRGQNMPYSEIARFVDKPEKQLKVYYSRLKQHLLLRVNNALTQLKQPDHGNK